MALELHTLKFDAHRRQRGPKRYVWGEWSDASRQHEPRPARTRSQCSSAPGSSTYMPTRFGRGMEAGMDVRIQIPYGELVYLKHRTILSSPQPKQDQTKTPLTACQEIPALRTPQHQTCLDDVPARLLRTGRIGGQSEGTNTTTKMTGGARRRRRSTV